MVWGSMLCLLSPALGGDPIDPQKGQADPEAKVVWYDIRLLGLEGQAWSDTKAPFDRLPARAEGVVRPPVWNLSRNSTGLCVRFETSARQIQARWTLINKNLALPHMPATGVSGLDLYARTDDGRWRWLANGRPTAESNTVVLASGLPAGSREYMLYLPLYNGVKSVEIGLPTGAKLHPAKARPTAKAKPIVFYGTSITQGGCASRPGMVHTAIIGRSLDMPIVNLGFSGNGTLDLKMAKFLGEINAAVYVLDCVPNLNAEQIRERAVPFVQALRKLRPDTPILMVEDRTLANAEFLSSARNRNTNNRSALKEAFTKLQGEGVPGLHYLKGDDLIGDDGEGTVDGSHPTDLGFYRQAQVMTEALRPILARP